MVRVGSRLVALTDDVLTPSDCRSLVADCLNPEQFSRCFAGHELDLNLTEGGKGFRIQAYLERGCPSLSVRRIRSDIPKLVELGLSGSSVEKFLGSQDGGLMLLTGRQRSGKANTYASLLNFINHQQVCRIISVEPAIQFWHTSEKSVVVQREVGSDTRSFPNAVRLAVQQDPDILAVGAIPDPETAEVVLQAAAGGHLVIAQMDSPSAVKAMENFCSAFNPQDKRMRTLVARVLRLVVCQHLTARADKRGQLPAHEILECTREIGQCLMASSFQDIPQLMERLGMQTLGRHLSRMIEVGLVNYDDALDLVDEDQLEVGRPSKLALAPVTAEVDGDVDEDTPLMSWL